MASSKSLVKYHLFSMVLLTSQSFFLSLCWSSKPKLLSLQPLQSSLIPVILTLLIHNFPALEHAFIHLLHACTSAAETSCLDEPQGTLKVPSLSWVLANVCRSFSFCLATSTSVAIQFNTVLETDLSLLLRWEYLRPYSPFIFTSHQSLPPTTLFISIHCEISSKPGEKVILL